MWKDKHLSFRVQYLLIVLLSVSLPLLVTHYYMIKQAEEALLEEKQNKLFGLAKQLDLYLHGNFDDLLSQNERTADRMAKIKVINQKLSHMTDEIASLYPGVGIGYYSKELDAVVAYAPSDQFYQNVGVPIAREHPGRDVLEQGTDSLHIGQQMRGDIMNAMHVLVRDGKIIGYTWANELTTDVSLQMKRMERNIYVILLAGLVLASLASYRLFSHVALFIDQLIDEIEKVGKDLTYRLSVPVGVLGRIPQAINEMIHQKQLAEEQIRRADRLRAVGELAAGMAHEIRNPLTSIKAFAQILEDGFQGHEETNRTYTKVIVDEVERLNRIVERLLLFAKPAPFQKVTVPFSSIVLETLPLVESEYRRKQIHLSQELNEQAPIAVDPELMRQVLLNLFLNAISATPEQKEMKLTLQASEHEVSFHLFNQGPTIPDEHKDRIFNPFFSTKEKGTGLGLSVSQSIVRLYQGRLTFENQVDGVTFSVYIPRAKD